MATNLTSSPADLAAGMARAIYEGLRDEITSGRLRPGTPLSRRQIAQRYGASYSPVIEAMVRLETIGLVEAERSQMARVREVSLETIEHDHTLREAYETQAIRLACVLASPAEVQELDRLAEQIERHLARGGGEEGAQLDWQFHERIAEISRSQVLIREMQRLGLLKMLRDVWLARPPNQEPANHHPLLVEHIKRRDPLAADALMREHVRAGRDLDIQAYQMRNHRAG